MALAVSRLRRGQQESSRRKQVLPEAGFAQAGRSETH